MVTHSPDGVRLLRTLSGHDGPIGRVTWSPDGQLLATPSVDGTTRIWDSESGACLRTIHGHRGAAQAVAFDPEGDILVTVGGEGAKLWNVASGELRATFDSGTTHAAVFSPDNRILATLDLGVTLWDMSTGAVLFRSIGFGRPMISEALFALMACSELNTSHLFGGGKVPGVEFTAPTPSVPLDRL